MQKEWSCSFTIVDPSIAVGFRVNCFQNKYVEWLPQPKLDDVIILRKLKVSMFILFFCQSKLLVDRRFPGVTRSNRLW